MIRERYDAIQKKQDLRKNLIALKQELKEKGAVKAFLYYVGTDGGIITELLKEEDAKVRKNAAAILGELGQDIFLEPLFQAYKEEKQLFVRSTYLKAIRSCCDYRIYLPDLKQRLEEIRNMELEENSKKHLKEEEKILEEMILDIERPKFHTFTGWHILSDVVLLTNRNYKQVTSEQVANGKVQELNAGICVRTDELEQLISIRTYSELLFMPAGKKEFLNEPVKLAGQLLQSGIIDFLKERHSQGGSFYFRIEMKSKMPLSQKSVFVKKLSSALEEGSNGQLINSASHYEVEFRIIQNKNENYYFMVKLYTIPENRFSYRIHSLPVSIRPVNAALTVNLAKNYLKQKANVLDPFCGAGTMLIERNMLVPAKNMYGIDIYGDAVKKGRENAKEADTQIYFINRDFFDFRHEYLFDEVISNLPSFRGKEEDAGRFYRKFFKKVSGLLQKNAVLVLYLDDKRAMLGELKKADNFRQEEMFEISAKEGTYVFVIRYLG